MTEGLPELTDAELEEIRLDAYGRPGYAQARGCDTQQAKLLLAEVHRLRAALREASRPQEAGNMLASPPATRFATDEELAASPPAKQETIVDFLRTRAKSHRAIGEADGDIRSDECEALADELEAHPLVASPPATTKGPNVEEKAWLVELGCSPPQWWTGRPKNGVNFSPDTNRAMRFARREDAEGAIGHLIHSDAAHGCKATEHIWFAASPPETAPARRSIELLRKTLSMLCYFVWNKQTRPGEHMWSIPVDKERDFDCILSDAIDELERLRAAHGSRPAGRPETET